MAWQNTGICAYRGLAALVIGAPLAFLLGGAASALAIYHEPEGTG